MDNALGLVMTGGGARGAYQAGVLKRIGEIKRVQTEGNPFPIIGGSSAGALNGGALGVGSDEFSIATKVLARLWAELRPSDIFRCDMLARARNSITWILDLSFGAVLGGGNAQSFLDATPLRHFLKAHLDCTRIQEKHSRRPLVCFGHFRKQLQLRKELSVHSRRKGPCAVEPEPPNHAWDEDHDGSHLRFGSDSIGISASAAQDGERHSVLRRRVPPPATAIEPGDSFRG